MNEYSIAAIPTMYRGRQYRSRLEARWAAFFDLMEFRHEYEPFDLGSWSPDFLLPSGHDPAEFVGVLAEVKPVQAFDERVALRMCQAVTDNKMNERVMLLLLGVSPWIGESGRCCIGWMLTRRDGFKSLAIIWEVQRDRPVFRPLAWRADQNYPTDGKYYAGYADYTMRLWAEATNAVQWRGRGAQS